jgi:hypothetical protein
MPYDQIGKMLLVLGAAIVVLGLVFLLFGRTPLGRLPGDFTFTTGNFTCFAPIATMILLSIILTIIANVVLRLFNK